MVAIPDLWPGLKLDILSPAAILRRQVEHLRVKGQGVLDAELTTVTGKDDFFIHRLDLIASQAYGQRYRVLVVTHRTEYYPLQIEADRYRPKTKQTTRTIKRGGYRSFGEELETEVLSTESLTWPPEADWRPIAWSQEDFVRRLGEVLTSSEVRSAIESFIARSNELLVAPESREPANQNPMGEQAEPQLEHGS